MKKLIVSVLFVITAVVVAHAQTFQWAHSLGLSNRSRAMAIANDSLGNVYTLGVDRTFTQSIMGAYPTGDLLLEKRDPKGNLQWAKHFPGHACGLDIVVMANNAIVITGAFYDSLYFGAGDTLQSPGFVDRMFFASFAPDGTLNWSKVDSSQWGAIGVSLTTAGNMFFVTGIQQDVEGMLRIYNTSGALVREKLFPGVRTIDNVVYDAAGRLYISGTCTPQAEFDGYSVPPDTGLAQYISYVAKLDQEYVTAWLHTNTYSTFDISSSVAFDNLGFLCRIRSSKDFQHTIFEVIDPGVDTLMASWQFQTSSANFDQLVTNALTSTGAGQTLLGPYFVNGRFDTTVIYQLRHGLSGQGVQFYMDTLAIVRGRGLKLDALSLAGRDLYVSGSFTDSVLQLGPITLANTNDFTKFQSDPFIACLTIDAAASVHKPEAKDAFMLYPNPAADEITLTFDHSGTREIKIYSITGTLVRQATSHTAREIIRLQDLPAGIYAATVVDAEGNVNRMSFIHR